MSATFKVDRTAPTLSPTISANPVQVGQTGVTASPNATDATWTRISDAEGAALAAACRVTFSVTGAQTKAADCMRYDPDKDQFVYTWKLGRTGTGAATINVTVS